MATIMTKISMLDVAQSMIEIANAYGKLHIYEVYESNTDSIIVRTQEDLTFDIDERGWKLIKLAY